VGLFQWIFGFSAQMSAAADRSSAIQISVPWIVLNSNFHWEKSAFGEPPTAIRILVDIMDQTDTENGSTASL
jgi:hypothetical protein